MAKPIKHRKKWRIRWIDECRRRHSEVYDTYADAQYAHRTRLNEIRQIKAGVKLPTPLSKTFEELCEYWLKNKAIYKRSFKDDHSIIQKHLKPAFNQIKLADVNISHIDVYVESKSHLDKKTIANHLTLLISMLNLAVELNWLIKAPKIKKPKIMRCDSDYQFLRNNEEIQRFLRTAHEFGEDVHILYSTAIYTGMRQGELAGLKWSDIHFERRLITVSRSFNGPTKSGDVRYVPILDQLLILLKEWRLKCPSELVFPNNVGKMHQSAARVFQEVFHQVLKHAQFPDIERKGKKRHYIVFHDLRHTFASHWVMNGGEVFKLQKILGHKSIQMTLRYAHLAPDAFASDYSRFGQALKTSFSNSVIPLKTA